MLFFKKKKRLDEKMQSAKETTHETKKTTEIEKDDDQPSCWAKNPIRSGFKCLENVVESNVDAVKAVGEKGLAVAESIKDEGEKIANTVEDGVTKVKETAEKCVNIVDGGVDNIMKLKRMCENFYNLAFKYKAYLEDESYIESTIALATWLAVCYIFQIWMVPVVLLIIYIFNFIKLHFFGIKSTDDSKMSEQSTMNSMKEKMAAVQEIIGCIQGLLGKVESLLGKLFGILHFHISWLAILIQIGVTLILIYIPINYMLMLWGISLYMKKFLRSKSGDEKQEKENAATIVDATEELQDVTKNMLTFNFSKSAGELKDAYGKLSSKNE